MSDYEKNQNKIIKRRNSVTNAGLSRLMQSPGVPQPLKMKKATSQNAFLGIGKPNNFARRSTVAVGMHQLNAIPQPSRLSNLDLIDEENVGVKGLFTNHFMRNSKSPNQELSPRTPNSPLNRLSRSPKKLHLRKRDTTETQREGFVFDQSPLNNITSILGEGLRHVIHDKSIESAKKDYESTQRRRDESEKKKYKPSVDVNFYKFLNDHTLSLTRKESLNSSVDCLENIQE